MTMIVIVAVQEGSAYEATATVIDLNGNPVYPPEVITPGLARSFGIHAGTQLVVNEKGLHEHPLP